MVTLKLEIVLIVNNFFVCWIRKVPAHHNQINQRLPIINVMSDIDIPFPIRTATLLRELDKRFMVWLRDGRTLIGTLRSVDQFANLVLHKTVERIHVGTKYGDLPVGVMIVRGENVVLLGEIDPFKEVSSPLTEVSLPEILSLQKAEQEKKYERSKLIRKALRERGISTALEAVALADRNLNFLE